MDPLSIVMILAVVVLIFFMFRNGKKRQQAQQELRNSMTPGTDIMLGSGIYGTILSVDEENNRAVIESGTTTLEVHIQAISQVVNPTHEEATDEAESAVAPDDDPEFGERVASVEDSAQDDADSAVTSEDISSEDSVNGVEDNDTGSETR